MHKQINSMFQVIQFVTLLSPSIGAHLVPLKGSLKHPKKVTAWITCFLFHPAFWRFWLGASPLSRSWALGSKQHKRKRRWTKRPPKRCQWRLVCPEGGRRVRIIWVSKWLGSGPTFISHEVRPFGRGTLPYLGDLLPMVFKHLLTGMILQAGRMELISVGNYWFVRWLVVLRRLFCSRLFITRHFQDGLLKLRFLTWIFGARGWFHW